MQRRRVVFSGRVQGVGFRATTKAMASGYPVSGWVRNEPDETVALEVQGESADVEAFLTDLRIRMGRLIRSEIASDLPPADGEGGFEIRR